MSAPQPVNTRLKVVRELGGKVREQRLQKHGVELHAYMTWKVCATTIILRLTFLLLPTLTKLTNHMHFCLTCMLFKLLQGASLPHFVHLTTCSPNMSVCPKKFLCTAGAYCTLVLVLMLHTHNENLKKDEYKKVFVLFP